MTKVMKALKLYIKYSLGPTLTGINKG